MSDTQLDAIKTTAAEGSVAYNTTDDELNYHDGNDWKPIGGGGVGIFGAWNDRDKDGVADTVLTDTVYHAATDGIVCAYKRTSGGNEVTGFTDGNNPPNTIRVRAGSNYTGKPDRYSITMPVQKGDYWKVGYADAVWWLPIGT